MLLAAIATVTRNFRERTEAFTYVCLAPRGLGDIL